MVRSKLKIIADERGLSIRKIAEGSGLHFEIVRRMYNDTMERYPRDTLDALCTFLGVGIADLLIYEGGESVET